MWDWLQKSKTPKKERLGDQRFERLLWIYRYHELVLLQRYGNACRGNVERVDRALGKVISQEWDTVKRLRLALRHSLKQPSR
jgi:hypothetical protein